MTVSFIHLKLHSEYSLHDSLVKIKPLVASVAAKNMPAVAITDSCNLFSLVKFFRSSTNAGIKPIFGADLYFANNNNPRRPYSITVLCQNDAGYYNLTKLISLAYIQGQVLDRALINYEWLKEHNEGLIAISGGMDGELGQAILTEDNAKIAKQLNFWQQFFKDRFYLEISRVGKLNEENYISKAVALAVKYKLPLVATNDVCFLEKDDYFAHEARVCIAEGYTLDDPKRPRNYTNQQYLRTPEEMQRLFADLPHALVNTVEIAKRCNVTISLGQNYLPQFPVPEGVSTEEYLLQLSQQGLEKRLQHILNEDNPDYQQQKQTYAKRLETEVEVINTMGFPGYFLIVADFIKWAKQHKIPVGPGRGSGAGSLVAYALEITDLDPLQYDLLFERFLNPERVSMPDFDIDFCMDGRDRVIEYVAQTYGRDSVSQIITYGTMAAKAVVRDAGRVLGHPYGFVDKIAKLIPFAIGMTLDIALEQEEELKRRYNEEDEVKALIDLAKKLEGLTRNVGKHAGGVVIAPSKLTDFTPIYCEADGSNLVTQFDKDDVEAVGLVKFDFLGLKTLTVIDWAVKSINKQRQKANEELLDIAYISLTDEKTFKLMQDTKTTAVFQLESRGMKDLIRRLAPDKLDDIIALVALFRPGPLQSGMVDDFINRRHGRATVEYPHPKLEPILKSTYGVILYQEQVMQIAQVLAGYSLGQADLLRRAMGKKKPEEMERHRDIFTKGAVANGVEEQTATYIFDLMEKFAGYGFNKSHSAAYGLLSYQTGWLKANYAAQFMAATLSADMHNTDKVVMLIDDCRQLGLKIQNPNVNLSYYKFTVKDNVIIYGLGAVKGVGEAAIAEIINVRRQQGEFKNLYQLCTAIDTRKVGRRTLEALIMAGALDDLAPHRAVLMLALEDALKAAEQQAKTKELGQGDLFASSDVLPEVQYPSTQPWPMRQMLAGEKAALGLYLSGHPLDSYSKELPQLVSARIAELRPQAKKIVKVAGQIIALKTRITKDNERIAFGTLDDASGRLEIALFAETYRVYRDLVNKDELVIVEGEVGTDNFTGGVRMLVKKVMSITGARKQRARQLTLKLPLEINNFDDYLQDLKALLAQFKESGSCKVKMQYHLADSLVELVLPDSWRVVPDDELLLKLKDEVNVEAAVEY